MLDSLAFDKINTFDFFPLFFSLKQLSLYTVKDREKIKSGFSSKAKGSNVRDCLAATNTVEVPPVL
jgi:hypothetical protein